MTVAENLVLADPARVARRGMVDRRAMSDRGPPS